MESCVCGPVKSCYIQFKYPLERCESMNPLTMG